MNRITFGWGCSDGCVGERIKFRDQKSVVDDEIFIDGDTEYVNVLTTGRKSCQRMGRICRKCVTVIDRLASRRMLQRFTEKVFAKKDTTWTTPNTVATLRSSRDFRPV